MSLPFYVAPEQVMKDRADFARKGIARGRPLVVVECTTGVVFAAENPSRSLHKTSEIYDRIAFAAVGRYNEFEALRVAGIRLADLKGYQYSRDDVSAKPLANAYSQALGMSFMSEQKPIEVELLIAQVASDPGAHVPGRADLYHVLYDGTIVDEHRYVAFGGEPGPMLEALERTWRDDLDRDAAVRVAVAALAEGGGRSLGPGSLEVSGLDATRARRCFFRLGQDELAAVLGP